MHHFLIVLSETLYFFETLEYDFNSLQSFINVSLSGLLDRSR